MSHLIKKFLFTGIIAVLLSTMTWRCQRNLLGALPELPIGFLKNAPDTLTIQGQAIVLRTSLWRDFMPICPPNGRPLIALIKIETVDSSNIAADIDSDALYIIYKNDVWHSRYAEEMPPNDRGKKPFQVLKIARNGPKWGPRVYVDVVIRVIADGKHYFLRASDQYIGATF